MEPPSMFRPSASCWSRCFRRHPSPTARTFASASAISSSVSLSVAAGTYRQYVRVAVRGYVWAPGYWAANGHRHVTESGAWTRRGPRHGMSPGTGKQRGGGWVHRNRRAGKLATIRAPRLKDARDAVMPMIVILAP
ncbi:MAG: YXWGXW repeat-containing protein [Sulfuritalea sp.]|nr:YXWGXW repeat-containing protein [Sulfuritalea sp.]